DNETAIQIRETTSALVYGICVLPLFGAWGFTAQAAPSLATGVIALAGLAGATSYVFYYKGIQRSGAARGMALTVACAAWAGVFGLVWLGTVPNAVCVVRWVVSMAGTVLAACDWDELLG